jgi:hypothetical protein
MLENQFIEYMEEILELVNGFIVPKVAAYLNKEKKIPKFRLANLKMVDDIQQKQNAINLNSANRLSDETLLAEMGFDRKDEYKKMESELKERDKMEQDRMVATAKAQGEAQLIAASYQKELASVTAEIQEMMAQMGGGEIPPPPGAPEDMAQSMQMGTGGNETVTSDRKRTPIQVPDSGVPVDMNRTTAAWAKTIQKAAPETQKSILQSLQNFDGDVHQMVLQRIQEGSGTATDMRPAPDQKPQRRKKKTV